MCMCAHSVLLDSFVTPRTVAHQAPLSMEFSRQEYWSGLPFPPPGVLPDTGMEPSSPALAGRFFTSVHWGSPEYNKLHKTIHKFSSVQFSSVAQSCPTLCNPMNCSTPGLPVHHQLPEFTQTHIHWVSDAIQLYHPLSSPSPPVLSLFQHQGLFKWVSFPHQVAKVLEFQLQHQSYQWTPRTDLLKDGPVGSPCSPRDSQESSPTP